MTSNFGGFATGPTGQQVPVQNNGRTPDQWVTQNQLLNYASDINIRQQNQRQTGYKQQQNIPISVNPVEFYPTTNATHIVLTGKKVKPMSVIPTNQLNTSPFLQNAQWEASPTKRIIDEAQVQEENAKKIEREDSPSKRHLPILAKNKIFNEWGAVFLHQDEVTHAHNLKDAQQKQQLKSLYKQNLDKQRAEQESISKNAYIYDRNLAQIALQHQQEQDRQRFRNEQQRQLTIKEETQRKQKAQFQEIQTLKIAEKDSQITQRLSQKQLFEQLETEEQLQNKMRKEALVAQQADYRQYLQKQTFEKLKQQKLEVQQDNQFKQLELAQMLKNEQARKMDGDRVKNMQQRQLSLQELAAAYGQKPNLQQSSEEERLRKLTQDQEIEFGQKQFMEEMQKKRQQQEKMMMLQMQIQEHENQKTLKKLQDQQYAQHVQQWQESEKQKETEQVLKQQREKEHYRAQLSQQMISEKQRKKYEGSLMTEHERIVNDGAIQAYKNQDRTQSQSALNGIGQSYGQIQQKYIHNAFSRQIGSFSPNVNVNSSQLRLNLAQNQVSSSMKQLPQASLLNVGNLISQSSLLQQSPAKSVVDQGMVRDARENMEQAIALQYRQNTGNRGYGFNPILGVNTGEETQSNHLDDYKYRGVQGNKR